MRARGQLVIDFLKLGRPLFLLGSFVFHGLGIAMALWSGGSFNWKVALVAHLAILATQVMTHYSNDYFDLDGDQLNTHVTYWAGGSRVLVDGAIPPQAALVTALGAGGVALFATLLASMLSPQSALTAGLLLSSIVLAWGYSSPPLYFNRRGVGEMVGGVLVPGLTTLVGYQVQTGMLSSLALATVIPLCFLQVGMLLAVQFPDAESDAVVAKRTLVVRLGGRRGAWLYALVLACGYAALAPALMFIPGMVVWWMVLPLPLAVVLATVAVAGIWRRPQQWNWFTFATIALLMGTALLATAAYGWLVAFSRTG